MNYLWLQSPRVTFQQTCRPRDEIPTQVRLVLRVHVSCSLLHSLHLNPQFARVLEILPILYPDRHYYVLGRPTANLSCSTTAADSKGLKLAYAFG